MPVPIQGGLYCRRKECPVSRQPVRESVRLINHESLQGKSRKRATMYTVLKGVSTGFHHLEILSVGEVCIKMVCCLSGRYLSSSALFQNVESDSWKLLAVATGVTNSLS